MAAVAKDEAAAPVVMLVLAHPRPGSYNHALADRLGAAVTRAGATLLAHDLYAEGFDPVLRAEESFVVGRSLSPAGSGDPLLDLHRAHVASADALVVVHPNWWGKPPAILAGWLDRVLVPGVAYRLPVAGGLPEPLLRVRRLVVVNTTDTPAEREVADFGDPLADVWERCVGSYLGPATAPTVVDRTVLASVNEADDARRARWLDDMDDVGARVVRLLV
ncbi:NAD(P)H dehydrogenase (quinone) [Cellulomonas chitinilytica]|uniref:NAD(P)H dehydrogenase (Quinone) n=1 Tax=Cellulomonas chitinilytica TaxID=398759 RepID=A0A919P5F9_9CELL|nr:NAD(P)H-dependent oxidoreductase [Cellulomonas chitinilytica]GIG23583.1 NAD(P)H dehydrogenase (quinone) [Cellulomonas chitinilytica]